MQVSLLGAAGFLDKWAQEKNEEMQKALYYSIQFATGELRKKAKADLENGQLGLKPITPFRGGDIVRKKGYKRRYKNISATEWHWIETSNARLAWAGLPTLKVNRNPLQRLSRGISYVVSKDAKTAGLGFMAGYGPNIWRTLAGKHQDGYTITYDDNFRDKLHRWGVHLKKTTKTANVPPRDIIHSLFSKHARWWIEKIKTNFSIKKAGGRIGYSPE